MPRVKANFKSIALWIFLAAFGAALVAGFLQEPTGVVTQLSLDVIESPEGKEVVFINGIETPLSNAIPILESPLDPNQIQQLENPASIADQFVFETVDVEDEREQRYYLQSASRHWGIWSFLPALTAILLCWITKEPISALLAGIFVGAALIGKYDVLGGILVPAIGTPTAATILILYMWLLGGLMGLWAKTGASEAFADYVSARFVRGPRSAKFVAWLLGIIFFQGGTISAVLVGTTVRPLADEEKVAHEELSLIVDATSSPIAILLAFNAWPIYVQAFMSVPGVTYLATESDRISFFFDAIPLSFYAMFSVLFTFLVAVEKHPFMPKKLKEARKRARETGLLNGPDAEPLAGEDPNYDRVPSSYTPDMMDFILPLFTLLATAVGTYLFLGSPQILWAFGLALFLAGCMAWYKGMKLRELIFGALEGQKELILGGVILLLAITVGRLSQDVGGGHYLASQLGKIEWYWLLPIASFFIAVVIAFSTGTSWATFAVTLPLIMPLAYAISQNQNLANPKLFLATCFAASLNGGVFGDQCSPISDTTILSSMCTGADLMDHVTTQIPVALQAAFLALVGWTILALTSV